MEITPAIVNAIDSHNPTPLADYNSILKWIKEEQPTLQGRQLANFCAHFLTGFFEPKSKEWRMANALMANVYYYHYISLLDITDSERVEE